MTVFTFYWAPEGRPVFTVSAKSLRDARAQFRKQFRSTYARYMGEVYVECKEGE